MKVCFFVIYFNEPVPGGYLSLKFLLAAPFFSVFFRLFLSLLEDELKLWLLVIMDDVLGLDCSRYMAATGAGPPAG